MNAVFICTCRSRKGFTLDSREKIKVFILLAEWHANDSRREYVGEAFHNGAIAGRPCGTQNIEDSIIYIQVDLLNHSKICPCIMVIVIAPMTQNNTATTNDMTLRR